MDDLARTPATDRADLFQASAARRGLSPAIVEKDFWVCWILRRLFTLRNPAAGLLFKGGTSLSKVFGIIERFSEDVDLSIDRRDLGFQGEADPLEAKTGKKRRRAIDALSRTCRDVVEQQLLPGLTAACSSALNAQPGPDWGLQLIWDAPDHETILFRYPGTLGPRAADEPAYIRPVVRLEISARSETWPSIEAEVTPYAGEDFPHLFALPRAAVHVMAAERTFWEKATILHTWYHAPLTKPLRGRQSRHYYDLVRMYEHGVGRKAVADTNLLIQVAQHKAVFFPSAWAKYHEARPGTLRLVPPTSRMAELQRDYESMREMIFAEPPPFDHLIRALSEIETTINSVA